MKTSRLSFGKQPDSPVLQAPGIILKMPRDGFSLSKKEPIWIYGCCRIGKKELNADKKQFPSGIFITAVELFRQQPVSANVIGDHIIFEDDIVDTGNDYMVFFHVNPFETARIPVAPSSFIMHASFHNHISNFVFIELAY